MGPPPTPHSPHELLKCDFAGTVGTRGMSVAKQFVAVSVEEATITSHAHTLPGSVDQGGWANYLDIVVRSAEVRGMEFPRRVALQLLSVFGVSLAG
jgi:hypothetical protein